MVTNMTTNMETLKKADWDGLERDVVGRIRVLRIVANKLGPAPIHDEIAKSLILPNLELLAQFCTNIEVDPNELELAIMLHREVVDDVMITNTEPQASKGD